MSSHSTCEISGQSAQCVAHNIFKPVGTVCKLATQKCEMHGRCDGNNGYSEPTLFTCPEPSPDGCVTYECPEPGIETCVKKQAAPVDCQYEVLPPQNPVCGATYIGTVSIISPAKCGGQQCPTTISVMAPPCTPTATATVTATVTATATLTATATGTDSPTPTNTATATSTITPQAVDPICLNYLDLERWGACGGTGQSAGNWIPIIGWTGGSVPASVGIYQDSNCTIPAITTGSSAAVVMDNSAQDAEPTDRLVSFLNTNSDRCPTIDKMVSYVGVSDGIQKVCIPWSSGGGNCDPPPPPPPPTATYTPTATPTITPAAAGPTCACGYLATPNNPTGSSFCQNVCNGIPGPHLSSYQLAGYCICSSVPGSTCPTSANGAPWVAIGTAPSSCRP